VGNNPLDNLEFALLADDVPIDKVYPWTSSAPSRSMYRIKRTSTCGGRPAPAGAALGRREVELATS